MNPFTRTKKPHGSKLAPFPENGIFLSVVAFPSHVSLSLCHQYLHLIDFCFPTFVRSHLNWKANQTHADNKKKKSYRSRLKRKMP